MTRITPVSATSVLVSVMLLAACASPAPKPEAANASYELRFTASSGLNPRADNRPAPVLVGVYVLKSTAAFDAAGFGQLQDQPKDTLGNDLIAFEQLILVPGETRTLAHLLDEHAQAIGFVAGYRTQTGNQWKTSVAVPPKPDKTVWQTLAPLVPIVPAAAAALWPDKPVPLRIAVAVDDTRITVKTQDDPK